MRVVVLTTETLHHTYFVRELAERVGIEQVLLEREPPRVDFETHHPFEDVQDDYERGIFFEHASFDLSEVTATMAVGSINDEAAISRLTTTRPDVIIVFGTGRLSPSVIQTCPTGIVNLHGGDPEEYRGLDTHLWAIYHRDFGGLVTTLHRVNEHLDDGDIVLKAAIPLRRGMQLHELRRYNTEICVQLALGGIDLYVRRGCFPSCPQRRRGRYYSLMPSSLKEMCQATFESYTANLP